MDDRNGSGWIVLKKSGPAKVQVLLLNRRLPRAKEKIKKAGGARAAAENQKFFQQFNEKSFRDRCDR